MKICKHCGAAILDGDKVCPFCKRPVEECLVEYENPATTETQKNQEKCCTDSKEINS